MSDQLEAQAEATILRACRANGGRRGQQVSTKAFMSTNQGQLREASTYCDLWPVAEVDRARAHAEREALAILAAIEPNPPFDAWHVYHGPRQLTRSATETSVNGISPASFVVEGRKAIAESLVAFIEACDYVAQDAQEGGH